MNDETRELLEMIERLDVERLYDECHERIGRAFDRASGRITDARSAEEITAAIADALREEQAAIDALCRALEIRQETLAERCTERDDAPRE